MFNDEEKKYEGTDIEVMLTSELNMANDLSNSIKFNNKVNHYFNNGVAESSTIGELFGLPFRGRADYLKGNHLIDLKTTTKLGENGKPIYNESGKVMKGPNYFKPDLSKFIK